ncbi:hypothetical protein H0R94_06865 [Treponema socranskii]|uniref:hypothetical protein n=1 Tax=Treponema socranskii TaxID=53419 RepID=UPI003D927689
MATLDDLQAVAQLLATDKILLRQSGTDYSATIDKLQPIVLKPVLDGTVPAAKALSVSAFAICASAADDPVKTATIENFKLIPGTSISLEIQNGNTANDLKQIAAGTTEDVLKLNISNTGAYEIRIQNINTHGYKGCFTAGGIYEFIFDGTYWICTNSNISAVDQSENASYIKYTNGLIKQWGYALGDEVNVVLPIPYKIRYSISLSLNYHSNFDGWSRTGTYEAKTLKGFHISICIRNEGAVSDWTTIGF